MTMALLQFINLEEILGNTPGRTWMDKSTCFVKLSLYLELTSFKQFIDKVEGWLCLGQTMVAITVFTIVWGQLSSRPLYCTGVL